MKYQVLSISENDDEDVVYLYKYKNTRQLRLGFKQSCNKMLLLNLAQARELVRIHDHQLDDQLTTEEFFTKIISEQEIAEL